MNHPKFWNGPRGRFGVNKPKPHAEADGDAEPELAGLDRDDAASVASSASSKGGQKPVPMILVPAPQPKKSKRQPPQDTIDEFWSKFNSKTPGQATAVLPKNVWTQKASDKVPKGLQKGENAVASYDEAAQACKDKVAQIVRECRRVNQKYRDVHFDIEFDLKWGQNDCLNVLRPGGDDDGFGNGLAPQSVKRVTDIFDSPQFYDEGASAGDVRQGRNGDCWFLAALCTLSNQPGLIEKVCVARDEQVGVYGFVFHRDGEWVSVIIDDKLYLTLPDYDESYYERNLLDEQRRVNSEEDYRKLYQSNSGALYFAQCESPNETWLPLMEKAYAKIHGDYDAIQGGFTGEALEDLTGGITTELFSADILDKERFWKDELLHVNQDFLFGCWTGLFGGQGDRKGIVEGHAYSIMRAVEIDGQRLCLLRNPWGTYEWHGPWSDGSKEWTPEWMQKLNHRFGDDGAFWISYSDLLKKFQAFDRTRLFGKDWKVTQQWTSLTVPWSVDYHNTKFCFTLSKKAPVVIVLSQLDDRYFRGLEGRYTFKLAFRVHKDGEEDYITRSHGNYCMSRSVTAELELEAGEYHVLVKVEATKNSGAPSVEQMIRDNARSRPEKLMRIGLSYDLAYAKGVIKETAEEKKARKQQEHEAAAKAKKEMKDKLMKEKRQRKHIANRELRRQRADAEKRKAKEKRKAAKKAEKEKTKKEKEKTDEEAKANVNDDKHAEAETGEEPEGKDEVKSEKTAGGEANGTPKEAPSPPNPESKEQTETTVPTTTEGPKPEPSSSETKAAEVTTEAVEPQPPAIDAPTLDGSVTGEEKASEEKDESQTAPGADADAKEVETSPAVESASAPASEPAVQDSSVEKAAPTPDTPEEEDDDEDDLSDLDSVVSDMSSVEIGDAVEQARLDAAAAYVAPAEDELDEFESDPWNAISVVGLRVYSRDAQVAVRVVRPRDRAKEEKETPAEGKLDVDDSAADAVAADKTETGMDQKADEESNSSGSVVVV